MFGGVRVGFPTGQAVQQKILESMTVGHKKQKTKSLSAMHEGNALDISEVWPLNGRQLPTRTSEGGRFSDERSFSPQTHLPCDGRSCGFDLGGSPYVVPAIFSQFEDPRLALAVPGEGGLLKAQERPNLQSVPGRCSPERSAVRKSISTSVVVAVTVCREWF
jgi:hypothetical protein